jgi:hypothetical protein
MRPGVTFSSIPRRHFKQKINSFFLRENSGNDFRTSSEISKLLEPNPEVGNFPTLLGGFSQSKEPRDLVKSFSKVFPPAASEIRTSTQESSWNKSFARAVSSEPLFDCALPTRYLPPRSTCRCSFCKRIG